MSAGGGIEFACRFCEVWVGKWVVVCEVDESRAVKERERVLWRATVPAKSILMISAIDADII